MSAVVIDIRLARAGSVLPLPERRGPTLAQPGIAFEAWAECHSARIWDLMIKSGRRDTTFNALARELWAARS